MWNEKGGEDREEEENVEGERRGGWGRGEEDGEGERGGEGRGMWKGRGREEEDREGKEDRIMRKVMKGFLM